MDRPEISNELINDLVERFREELQDQIAKKGRTGWVSSHETSGCILEEFDEFKQAVHDNDREQAKKELSDLMVAALWGLASEEAGGWDW